MINQNQQTELQPRMPKKKEKKKGRKPYLTKEDRKYARSQTHRRYESQLDRWGCKLEPTQDKLVTKPSRRGSRHRLWPCTQCSRGFRATRLEAHEQLCGREKRQYRANEAKMKQLGSTRTFFAR